ncbi:DUF416 family protein [Microcoleus sp. Pol7_A1]|uniref:DUF416 family protein n=1 Tax=Microcoleus sp. Pol7_A1 TaxID=2818893 RepID=UPI002FD3D5E3
MTPQFFNLDSLEQELKQLSHLHQVAFAASICERMLPMYEKFSQMENWGQPSLLREVLDEVWLILQEKSIAPSKIRKLMEKIDGEGVCPDLESDEFCDAHYAFEAQFTISALYSTLTALLTSDSKYIIGVVRNARFDTIEGFIGQRDKLYELKNSQDMLEPIANDPLAKQEIAKEMEDLQNLKKADKLSAEFLEWLRTSSCNKGKSLIDLL